jgi:GT2 family glycosyltransferase
MYSDDVDLSYRMLLKENNYYYPETTVIHYKESTVKDGIYETVSGIYAVFYKSTSRFQFFSFYENRICFLLLKCFRVNQRKKDPESYILYSSTDELISKMESKLKSIFHDLKTEKMFSSKFSGCIKQKWM